MDPQELLQIFLTESDDLVADLEQGLVTLEVNPSDDEAINRVFRAVHTLKSNAGMVGIEAIVEFAHVAENVLDRIRSHGLSVTGDLVTVLLSCTDVFRRMIADVADARPVTAGPEQLAVLERLRSHLRQPVPAPSSPAVRISKRPEADRPSPGSHVFDIRLVFRDDIFATGQDPALLVLELYDLGEVLAVRVDVEHIPMLDAIDPYSCYLSWRILLRTDKERSHIEGVFVFVHDENNIVIRDVTAEYHHGVDIFAAEKKVGELLIEAGAVKEKDITHALQQQKKLGELLVEQGKIKREVLDKVIAKQDAARQIRRASSIRVDTDKLDKLVNLVGELVISVAQVNQRTRDKTAADDSRTTAVESLEQISRDLQDQVMSLRMVPVEDTFARFSRSVRDIAAELGKSVILETSGTETELDKNVIEQLGDPLKHMVRNCVCHGIESPADRIAAGKSDTGRIFLRASQREGHIVIEVADDGRGIDPDLVLEKARERGLVPEGRSLTDKQLYDLLFEPGFSTAKEVSELSGRGVGLDVVRQNVEALRGSIEIESEVGRGTTFRIKLPLTLAIIDGMNVKVGGETVTIPLLSVVELIEHKPETV